MANKALPLLLLGGGALLVMSSKKKGERSAKRNHGYELIGSDCNHIRVYDLNKTNQFTMSKEVQEGLKEAGISPLEDIEATLVKMIEMVFPECEGKLPPEDPDSFKFTDSNGKDWDWNRLVEINQKIIDTFFKGVGSGQMGGPDLVSRLLG